MYSLIRPLLFALDPERAHGVAVVGLKGLQAAGPLLGLARRFNAAPPVPVTVAGIRFPNPVGLAAGFDKDAELVPALAALGFGFIEVGTLTRKAQTGNPRPRVFRYPEHGALVNRLGFNNAGVEAAARRLERMPRPVPVGINIGKGAATPLEQAPREYAECVEIVHPFADYLVLNISSPNTADLRRMHEPDRLRALWEAVAGVLAKKGRKPLFLKISPDAAANELAAAASLAVETGTGLVATNTSVDRTGLDGLEPGGLSGRPLKARAQGVLQTLREATGGKVPLIGVGGIFNAADARERLAAGADLVQVYTGLIYRGPGLVREILEDLALNGMPPLPHPLPASGERGTR